MYAIDFPSGTERSLAKQVYRTQGKLPDRIQNAPRILPGLQLYLSAFFELDRERTIGVNGREVIKQRDIRDYAEAHDYEYDQLRLLEALIPRMDNAFMTRLDAKRATSTK